MVRHHLSSMRISNYDHDPNTECFQCNWLEIREPFSYPVYLEATCSSFDWELFSINDLYKEKKQSVKDYIAFGGIYTIEIINTVTLEGASRVNLGAR